jgi:hypothetical protein
MSNNARELVDELIDQMLKVGDDHVLLTSEVWEAFQEETGLVPTQCSHNPNDTEIRYRGLTLQQSGVE